MISRVAAGDSLISDSVESWSRVVIAVEEERVTLKDGSLSLKKELRSLVVDETEYRVAGIVSEQSIIVDARFSDYAVAENESIAVTSLHKAVDEVSLADMQSELDNRVTTEHAMKRVDVDSFLIEKTAVEVVVLIVANCGFHLVEILRSVEDSKLIDRVATKCISVVGVVNASLSDSSPLELNRIVGADVAGVRLKERRKNNEVEQSSAVAAVRGGGMLLVCARSFEIRTIERVGVIRADSIVDDTDMRIIIAVNIDRLDDCVGAFAAIDRDDERDVVRARSSVSYRYTRDVVLRESASVAQIPESRFAKLERIVLVDSIR